MTMGDEIRLKEARVREFLRSRGLKALLLKRQANFSWMTCGGLNVVGIATEVGAASLLITPKEKFVLANNIEAPRMATEENLESQGFQIESLPWHENREEDLVRRLAGSAEIGSDVPFPGARLLAEDIARLRYSLTPDELVRYRWLGERVSLVLERTLMETEPGEKESEVVGRLCRALWPDRIDPVTLMSAADERIASYRHPIPTEKRVEKCLMVSVNARKWGLIVSLTRFCHFGLPPVWMRDRYKANVAIDCAFMAATRPGIPAREVLRKGIEAYAAQGYPQEWTLHHQGGSIGYTGRDYRTNFQTEDLVEENQAFTWNPSLTGTKSEDTILATGEGPELITKPVLYPSLVQEMDGIRFVRPDIFVKEAK